MTSRIAALLTGLSLLAACSRTSPKPEAEPVPVAVPPPGPVEQIARAAAPAPPVLFVGLDGADWQLLDDYIARGVMPNLAALVREGTSGVLETNRPPLSPLVWTTMVTGKSPLEHGILDFAQFDAQTGVKEPISSSLRKVPAIWNIAGNAGKKTAVFGLWATFPAEPVNGLMVSDRLFSFLFNRDSSPPGVVYPADREAWARDALARAEREADFATLKTYLPWLTEAEYVQHREAADPYAHPISALRRILVQTRVYDALVRAAFADQQPDLAIAYFEGTDSIGHVFAPYAPPRVSTVSTEDFERYNQVAEKYFRAIDEQLGAYRTLVAQAHGVLMIASDHGFYWKQGRPETLSSNANATAAKWHRSAGMYLLWGAGIAAGGHAKRGGVQQVCATLLSLAGLPPGEGLAGPVLPGAPAVRRTAVNYQPFYHPAPPISAGSKDSAAAADELAKLKALGYIADSSAARHIGDTRTPGSYNNEGVILRGEGQTGAAVAAFEKAIEADPNLASALWNLSDMLFSDRANADRSDDLLVRAYANGLPEGTKFLVGRAIGYQRAGQVARSLTLITAALGARPGESDLWLFRGRYRVDAGECEGAVADFQRAQELSPKNAEAFAAEGLAQVCAGDREAARQALARALELNPNQPKIRAFMNSLERRP